MAYNQELAGRVRRLLAGEPGVIEKTMFGGCTFMVMGNMCCGVLKNDLVVRIGQDRYQEALAQSSTRPMDFTGRPLKGMVYIAPEGLTTDDALKDWINWGLSFVRSLPPGRPSTLRRARRQQ